MEKHEFQNENMRPEQTNFKKFTSVDDIRQKREQGKKLTDEEFNAVSDFEFDRYLKKNPPIDGVFSPEDELLKIREMPFGTEEEKAARKEAREEYKEKLARQRRAIAECRLSIERAIENDNDVPKERLLAHVLQFGLHYGFTAEQHEIFEKIIDSYFSFRKNALDFRAKFPDDLALVRELSGLKKLEPEKIKVSVGPMSIDILADAYATNQMYKGRLDVIRNSGLMGFSARGKGNVFYTIQSNTWVRGGYVLAHEQEHVKNNLFKSLFEVQSNEVEKQMALFKYMNPVYLVYDSPKQRLALETYFYFEVKDTLMKVRDEFLARKKEGNEVVDISIFLSSDKGKSYDFLKGVKQYRPKTNKEKELWQETKIKFLGMYEKIIRSAVSSFDLLKSEGGYATDEVIALLTDKPLEEWKRTAERLLKQHKKEKPEKPKT